MIYQNLELSEAVETLQELHQKKVDKVVSPKNLEMILNGELGIKTGTDLFSPAYYSTPNDHMSRQIASKMDIPWKYYQKMMSQKKDLLSENVNAWLKEKEKNFLVRMYSHEDTTEGRAFLSDRFFTIENLDILMTVLQVIRDANMAGLQMDQLDISETRMFARFMNIDASLDARSFLDNYKNPVTGETGGRVITGFCLSNSEVGGYKMKVQPMVTWEVCKNRMVASREGFERVHLGGKMDEGTIQWSGSTMRKNLELIRSQIRDYVSHFSSIEYLQNFRDEYNRQAGLELEYPVNATVNACKYLGVSEKEQEDILNYFTRSGQANRGGIVQAVTYHAHEVSDPDRRYDLEVASSELLGKIGDFDKSKLN